MQPEKRTLSLSLLSFFSHLTFSLPFPPSVHLSPSAELPSGAIRDGLGRSGSTDNYLSSMFNRRPVFRIGPNDGV